MSGLFSVNVQEARGMVAVPADIDRLAVVMGITSAGSGLSPFYLSGQSAKASVGKGDAVDCLCQIIEQRQSNGTAIKYPAAIYSIPADVTGGYGTPAFTGTGTVTLGIDANVEPFGTYEAYGRCVAGGLIGTAGIKMVWSLDNGRNVSRVTALGTASSYTIPEGNVKFTFAPATADLSALNALINEIYTDQNAHVILTSGTVHGAADNADVVSVASASNTATRVARINALRVAYIAHINKTSGGVHGHIDATNVIVAPVAFDDSSALVLALDMKTKLNAHELNVTLSVHGATDTANPVTSSTPSAAALVIGDVVRVRTTAPAVAAADVDDAFAELAQSTTDVSLVVCEFDCDATMAAHLTSGRAAMLAAGKRVTVLARTRLPDAELSETEQEWYDDITDDFSTFDDSALHVRATYGLITDAMTSNQYLRSDLAQFAADVVRVSRSDMPDVPADQPMANFVLVDSTGALVGHDEGPRGNLTGLSNETLGNRFGCVQRIPGKGENVHITVPWTMFADDDRIQNLPTRRVANALEREAVEAGTSALGGKLFYTPAQGTNSPRLTAASVRAIHGVIFDVLSRDFKKDIQNPNDRALDSGLVQVDPVIVVSGGNLATVSVTVSPVVFGYLLSLNITLAVQE
jgi:hypothetical protein